MIDLGRAQLKSIHPVVSVPDSFGCYKPTAASNCDLTGPKHKFSWLAPALNIQKQESTVAMVPPFAYYSKRESDADPAIVYSAALPYTYSALTVKTLSLKFNVAATKAAVSCLKCKNPLEVNTMLLVEIMLILWYVSEERGVWRPQLNAGTSAVSK